MDNLGMDALPPQASQEVQKLLSDGELAASEKALLDWINSLLHATEESAMKDSEEH